MYAAEEEWYNVGLKNDFYNHQEKCALTVNNNKGKEKLLSNQ